MVLATARETSQCVAALRSMCSASAALNAFWRLNIGATMQRTRARNRPRQPAPAGGASASGSDSA